MGRLQHSNIIQRSSTHRLFIVGRGVQLAKFCRGLVRQPTSMRAKPVVGPMHSVHCEHHPRVQHRIRGPIQKSNVSIASDLPTKNDSKRIGGHHTLRHNANDVGDRPINPQIICKGGASKKRKLARHIHPSANRSKHR